MKPKRKSARFFGTPWAASLTLGGVFADLLEAHADAGVEPRMYSPRIAAISFCAMISSCSWMLRSWLFSSASSMSACSCGSSKNSS
ncbi:MAG: hypothetical protein U0168_09105 [Nannocystaceae bacterium]